MLEWLRDMASNKAFQFAIPLVAAGLIGIGWAAAPWLVLVGGLVIVLWVVLLGVWRWRWRFETTQLSSDPAKALKVSLQYEEWEAYQHAAWILMIKVKIQNRTPARQHINNWQLQGVAPGDPPLVPGLAQEVERRKRDHPEPPRDIPAHRSVQGWLFQRLPYAPVAGAPSYDLLLHADTGYQYGFRRTMPRPRPIPPAPAEGNAG